MIKSCPLCVARPLLRGPRTTGLNPLLPTVPLYDFMFNWNILPLPQNTLPQEEGFSKWVSLKHLFSRASLKHPKVKGLENHPS